MSDQALTSGTLPYEIIFVRIIDFTFEQTCACTLEGRGVHTWP